MIRCSHIAVGHNGRPVVENIDFTLGDGAFMLLCGRNGSGKSTILKTLAGLLKPLDGSLETDTVSMMPARLQKVKGFSVRQFVTLGYAPAGNRMDTDSIHEAMASTGTDLLADRDISSLSDGEFQKACIAGALARGGKTILLDEPTAFLDPDGKSSVLAAVRRIASEKGISFIVSSHDIRQCLPLADIAAGITPEGVFIISEGIGKEDVIKACFPESCYI